ncbi:MAG: endonuclease VII domain-containing protein [Armatimonadota bacterium]|nr:endonuclease VII domain-containing protein [Armatimonadota bacterium]
MRGLLCSSCNQALGLFEDNANLLRAAIRYLAECQDKG